MKGSSLPRTCPYMALYAPQTPPQWYSGVHRPSGPPERAEVSDGTHQCPGGSASPSKPAPYPDTMTPTAAVLVIVLFVLCLSALLTRLFR